MPGMTTLFFSHAGDDTRHMTPPPDATPGAWTGITALNTGLVILGPRESRARGSLGRLKVLTPRQVSAFYPGRPQMSLTVAEDP